MNHSVSKLSFAVVALLISTPLLAGDKHMKNKHSAKDAQSSSGVMPEVKVKDLNKRPERFAGQIVRVNGKVDRLEGGNAFILDGSGLFNDKILVVVETPRQQAGAESQEDQSSSQQAGMAAPVIKEKEQVQLQGKVVQVGVTKIEENYVPNMSAELKAEFEGVMPVLVVPPNGIKSQS